MQLFQAGIKQLDDVAFLFNEYRIFYGQDCDLEQARKFITARLQRQDSVIFLASKDGALLGYTQLFPSWSSVSMQRVWILNDLYVLPEHRRKGVAKALINAAKKHATNTNAARIILATEITNQAAQNLYESQGYHQFDEFKHYILKTA